MAKIKKRKKPDCPVVSEEIDSLSKYFNVLSGLTTGKDKFWYRGNPDWLFPLTPSALRYSKEKDRNKALSLLTEFQRIAELKIHNPPPITERLKWVQLAQHYGLPTRLLDWTENAAIGLYCACWELPEKDGGVFLLKPVDLNRAADPKKPRIFDANLDKSLITKYLELNGEKDPDNGLKNIAIQPMWNSERIILQQGFFTLHGSKCFTIDKNQTPSLVCIRIPKKDKAKLIEELKKIGVCEMSIFPETEHLCKYLKRNANLKREVL
jgi:hypothetical protein